MILTSDVGRTGRAGRPHVPGRNALPAVALGVLLLIGTAGCAAEAGMGAPTLTVEEADAIGAPSAHRGTIAVAAHGCVMWVSDDDDDADGAWIVWPEGTRHNNDTAVILPDAFGGAQLGDGSAVTVEAFAADLSSLPVSGDDQSYFGSFGRLCGADERGVLVVRSVTANG